MAIQVEFFGIPRARTGVPRAVVLEQVTSASLNQVLNEVADRFPEFARECMRDGKLQDAYVASIDGECFVHAGEQQVLTGQSVLILSADAGG